LGDSNKGGCNTFEGSYSRFLDRDDRFEGNSQRTANKTCQEVFLRKLAGRNRVILKEMESLDLSLFLSKFAEDSMTNHGLAGVAIFIVRCSLASSKKGTML
jgi:hypothetical protein